MNGTLLKDGAEIKRNVLILLFYPPLAPHETHISQTSPITRLRREVLVCERAKKHEQKFLQFLFLSNCFQVTC